MMRRSAWFLPKVGIIILCLGPVSFFVLAAQSPLPVTPTQKAPLSTQTAAMQYIPSDAALFVYVDIEKIWSHAVLKSIRQADPLLLSELTAWTKNDLGMSPDDVNSIAVFVPKLKNIADLREMGFVLTLRKEYDQEKLKQGVGKLLRPGVTCRVVPVDKRTVLILVGLGEEYAKPQPALNRGPLFPALEAVSSGKHGVVIGATPAKFPDELRGDALPVELRPFQPLFHAETLTATLDLARSLQLDVRVHTATAREAVDCEKSLGALLALIQTSIDGSLNDLERNYDKDQGLTDVLTLLKTVVAVTKNAKLQALGTEVNLSASMPADQQFGSALLFAKTKIQDAAAQTQSLNNLKQIALAMHNYHSAYNTFPPAAVCNKKGTPLLSWRVLILPYLEQEELFKQFQLDEPWDSEHNKKLIGKMPKIYRLPGKQYEMSYDTFYRVFVGNGAGFEWITGTQLTSILDGTSSTLMCVTAATAVPWTKPEELEFDPKSDMTRLLGAHINGKVEVVYFDGSGQVFGKIPTKANLNGLITKDGGEGVERP